MTTLFDKYSDDYEAAMRRANGFLGHSHDFFTLAKTERILALLRREYASVNSLQVLDLGCGIGKTDRFLAPPLQGLVGLDISAKSIAKAQRDNPSVRYQVYDGRTIPFPTTHSMRHSPSACFIMSSRPVASPCCGKCAGSSNPMAS